MKHIVVSDDIMEKVSSKEKNVERLSRCLAVGICPKCGDTSLDYEFFDDGGEKYDCTACDFNSST